MDSTVGLPVLDAHDAQRGLAAAVNRCEYAGTRTVIRRYGKPVAVLVPLADLAQLVQTSAQTTAAELQDLARAIARSETHE